MTYVNGSNFPVILSTSFSNFRKQKPRFLVTLTFTQGEAGDYGNDGNDGEPGSEVSHKTEAFFFGCSIIEHVANMIITVLFRCNFPRGGKVEGFLCACVT